MRIATIDTCDIANGPGARLSIWVSGCTHHCKNCFNPELWDFSKGMIYDRTLEDKLIKDFKREYIAGMSILGGDPLEPENQEGILSLVQRAKKECPEKTIYMWTGFDWDNLVHTPARCILAYVDVLIDGRFIEDLKDLSLPLRGSSNQRVIDVQESLKKNEIVEDDRWQKQ